MELNYNVLPDGLPDDNSLCIVILGYRLEDDGSMQLSFFQLDDPTLSSIKEKLETSDLNNMTPLQAFDLLRSLKGELGI